MKKGLLTVFLFICGVSMGVFVKKQIPQPTPEEQRISNYNWISCYDLYDYEEAVLKSGDYNKMVDITCEASVDKFPYMIVVHDVYKKNVCRDMLMEYNVYYNESSIREPRAMIPLRNYLKKVIKETDDDCQCGSERIKKFLGNE